MKLTIIHNPFEPENVTVIHGDNLDSMLRSEFKKFPCNAKIYHTQWSVENEITDDFIKDHNVSNSFDEIVVVIDPSELATIIAIITAIIAIATSVYAYMSMPKMKQQALQSSNNELVGRTNANRLGGREPEIFGQVRAYPDLIAETYNYYLSTGEKVERSLMCVTRGYIEVNDMKDATTDVEQINGTSISVYNPNVDITTDNVIYRSGRIFSDAPKIVMKSKSITGQALAYPDETQLESSDLYFTAAGEIRSRVAIDFTQLFEVGESIVIQGAVFGQGNAYFSGDVELRTNKTIAFTQAINIDDVEFYAGLQLTGALLEYTETTTEGDVTKYRDYSGQYAVTGVTKTQSGNDYTYVVSLAAPQLVNPSWNLLTSNSTVVAGVELFNNAKTTYLDDTYSISAITASAITLNNPSIVNDDWLDLVNFPAQSTYAYTVDVNLDRVENQWVGWYNIEMNGAEEVYFNVRFANGLYRQNSKGGTSKDYTTIGIEYQRMINGVPTGDIFRIDKRYDGKTRKPFGVTEVYPLATGTNEIRFRLCRTRKTIASNIQAEMRIEDVFLAKSGNKNQYPDVTVIQSETIGQDGVLSMKERKLNCLVTRKLPLNGTGELTATKSGAQALIYMALDSKNGRRAISEVDIDQILATESEIISYFGSSKAAEFSYTFDDSNLSFEECSGMIASSMFCTAYRFGSKLRLKFDKPQSIPTMLFSAANKVPQTEKRTKTFVSRLGFYGEGYDGIQLEYTSPDDDTRINYVASDNPNPINLQNIKTSGIRTHEQAQTRAWREWNKLKYQSMSVEFSALDESNLLTMDDLILVSDGTMVKTNSGYIESINGNQVELSNYTEAGTYFLYVQLPDMRVDVIQCTVPQNGYIASLLRTPLIPLVVQDGLAAYELSSDDLSNAKTFLVSDLTPNDTYTNTVIARNYDSRYYSKDQDFF